MAASKKKEAVQKSARKGAKETSHLTLVKSEEEVITPSPVAESVKKTTTRAKLEFSLSGLTKLIKEAAKTVAALEMIWGVSKENLRVLRILIFFAEQHAKAAAAKKSVDHSLLRRTVIKADKVCQALAEDFYATIRGWESRFDGSYGQIRAAAPEILEREAIRIAVLQNDLRTALEDDKFSFADVATAYRRLLDHLGSMQKTAKVVVREHETAIRREKSAIEANELLSELEELKSLIG